MSDLDRYKREQDEFFKLMEKEEKAAGLARLLDDLKLRGGDPKAFPKALRRFYDGLYGYYLGHRKMQNLEARDKAIRDIAFSFDMERAEITALLEKTVR